MANRNSNDGTPTPNSGSAGSVVRSTGCAEKKIQAKLSVCNLMSHIRLWSVVILGLSADLLSKSWALRNLGNPEREIPQPLDIIEGYIRFITVFNRGAVGGMASGKTTLLIVVSIVAVLFL